MLGRIHHPDVRDRAYRMRAVLDPTEAQFFPDGLPQGYRYYRQGTPLNQGDTGTCVAHAWCGWSFGAPLMTKPEGFYTPFNLYREIVKVDPWPENDFEATAPDDQLQGGTSVRAGAAFLKDKGHIAQYLWADSAEDVRRWHLAGFGGVVLGTTWTGAMFEPDSDGFIRYKGRSEGGHAYKTTGWSDTKKASYATAAGAVRIMNSWGKGWGQQGRAWITRDDLDKLIADDGEACAALERKAV